MYTIVDLELHISMGNLFELLIKYIVEWVDKIIKLYWNIFMIFLRVLNYLTTKVQNPLCTKQKCISYEIPTNKVVIYIKLQCNN
jgi:hypothetical protein